MSYGKEDYEEYNSADSTIKYLRADNERLRAALKLCVGCTAITLEQAKARDAALTALNEQKPDT